MGQHQLVAWLRRTVREAAQHEAIHLYLDLAFGDAAYRVQTQPPVRGDDHMKHAVDLDELDQPALAELVEERVEVELRCLLRVAAWRPAGAGLHRGLESAALTLEDAAAGGGRLTRLEEPGHSAQRRQLGLELP